MQGKARSRFTPPRKILQAGRERSRGGITFVVDRIKCLLLSGHSVLALARFSIHLSMAISSACFFLISYSRTPSKFYTPICMWHSICIGFDVCTSSCQNSAYNSLICLRTLLFSGDGLRPLLAFILLSSVNFLYITTNFHHFSSILLPSGFFEH
jgi:hypothetical protein